MRWGAHQRIAGYIAKICNLDAWQMMEGSIYPDKVGRGMVDDQNPYNLDFDYPHHKNTTEKVEKLILHLRKERLKGKISPFYLGALIHLISDRWCYSSDAGQIFNEFQDRLEKVEINPEWYHVGIWDSQVLRKVPDEYPFQGPGFKPDEREAMESAFKDSLMTVKSITAGIKPPVIYEKYHREAQSSLEKQKALRVLYWLLTYAHPFFIFNAILQRNTLAERNLVIKYARAKKEAGKNALVGICGILLGLIASPFGIIPLYITILFWFCVLPSIGQFITLNFEIRDEIMQNMDWYVWG